MDVSALAAVKDVGCFQASKNDKSARRFCATTKKKGSFSLPVHNYANIKYAK